MLYSLHMTPTQHAHSHILDAPTHTRWHMSAHLLACACTLTHAHPHPNTHRCTEGMDYNRDRKRTQNLISVIAVLFVQLSSFMTKCGHGHIVTWMVPIRWIYTCVFAFVTANKCIYSNKWRFFVCKICCCFWVCCFGVIDRFCELDNHRISLVWTMWKDFKIEEEQSSISSRHPLSGRKSYRLYAVCVSTPTVREKILPAVSVSTPIFREETWGDIRCECESTFSKQSIVFLRDIHHGWDYTLLIRDLWKI